MPATTTDLIDRYMHAVKFLLPKKQQADIVAEIGDDLQSQVEEREAALGHALNEDDVVALLKKRGSPAKVASGYLPERRLMNPAMLPVYWLVLKIVLLWVYVPLFAVVFLGPAMTVARPWDLLLRFIVELWRAAFMTVGMVTASFALLDRYQIRFRHADNWNPRKLPRVPGAADATTRWKHLAGSIFGVAATCLWAYLMWRRSEFSFPAGAHIILGPVWHWIYLPVIGVTLTSAFFDLFSALRPRWTQLRSRARIAIDFCSLAIAIVLMTTGNLVTIAGGTLSAEDLAKATAWLNFMIEGAVITAVVITIFDAIGEARRLWRGGRAKPAAVPTAV